MGDARAASFSKSNAEELDEVVLDVQQPDKTVRVGSDLSPDLRSQLICCLKQHADCVSWSHGDMVRISKDITTHRLNVDPSHPPLRQKRRKIGFNPNQVVDEEVKNLLATDKIREVAYLDWLANVVVIPKKNGKWRMCVDFTDLNKDCLKDSFPIPHIDVMADATAWYELLTFMDAYSGYNQILMDPDD